MEWTMQHMPIPDGNHAHNGTWGCNGEYHWRALSNGKDPHKLKYPNTDQRKCKWNAITGSNSLYSFHAGPGKNLARIHEMHVRFVECYCEPCRTDVSSNDCANLGSAGSPWYVALHEVAGRPPSSPHPCDDLRRCLIGQCGVALAVRHHKDAGHTAQEYPGGRRTAG